MMRRGKAPIALGLLLVLGGFGLLGCSSRTPPPVPGHNNLQALAVLYGRYIGQNRGKPPANVEEFKTWIKKQDKVQLEALLVDPANIDALFTSPRDNQPFGFVFTASAMMPGPEGKGSVVIYEHTGVGGKRSVAYTTGQVGEIDEATFKRLVPGK